MKWQSFMSTFVRNKMCELISSGVRTDKGFKEVHLNTVALLGKTLAVARVFCLSVARHPALLIMRYS